MYRRLCFCLIDIEGSAMDLLAQFVASEDGKLIMGVLVVCVVLGVVRVCPRDFFS